MVSKPRARIGLQLNYNLSVRFSCVYKINSGFDFTGLIPWHELSYSPGLYMEEARWFDSSLQGSAGKMTLQNILKRCVSVLVLLNTSTLLLCISISSPLSAVFLACQGLIHVLLSVHDISNHLFFPCKAGCSFNHWVQISAT